MLELYEVEAAMAFERDYQILGTKRDQVVLAGNAVTPPVMQLLVERVAAGLVGYGFSRDATRDATAAHPA